MATAPIQNCEIRFSKITGVQVTIPAGGLQSDHLSPASGNEIVRSKLHHTNYGKTDFGLKVTEEPTSQERWLYTARGPETIVGLAVQLFDTGTTTDIDFDVKKNGASILTGVQNVTHADTDREIISLLSLLTSAALVAGDTLTIDCAVTTATGALGPQAWVYTDSVGQ